MFNDDKSIKNFITKRTTKSMVDSSVSVTQAPTTLETVNTRRNTADPKIVKSGQLLRAGNKNNAAVNDDNYDDYEDDKMVVPGKVTTRSSATSSTRAATSRSVPSQQPSSSRAETILQSLTRSSSVRASSPNNPLPVAVGGNLNIVTIRSQITTSSPSTTQRSNPSPNANDNRNANSIIISSVNLQNVNTGPNNTPATNFDVSVNGNNNNDLQGLNNLGRVLSNTARSINGANQAPSSSSTASNPVSTSSNRVFTINVNRKPESTNGASLLNNETLPLSMFQASFESAAASQKINSTAAAQGIYLLTHFFLILSFFSHLTN